MSAAPNPSGSENLTYLVYTSVETRPMEQSDLEDILRVARSRNESSTITGLLLYRGSSFIQFLEGPPAEIDALMADIAADQRHRNVRVLISEPAAARSFPDWRMGFRQPQPAEQISATAGRDSFLDLAESGDTVLVRAAARDMTTWFRDSESAGA